MLPLLNKDERKKVNFLGCYCDSIKPKSPTIKPCVGCVFVENHVSNSLFYENASALEKPCPAVSWHDVKSFSEIDKVIQYLLDNTDFEADD